MEESIQDVQSIQKMLSVAVVNDGEDLDWADVESELESLLSGTELAAPPRTNTMSTAAHDAKPRLPPSSTAPASSQLDTTTSVHNSDDETGDGVPQLAEPEGR